MSEMIDRVVADLYLNYSGARADRQNPTAIPAVARMIPTYYEAKRRTIGIDPWSKDLTPRHNTVDGRWANEPTSFEPMREEMFYATIWVLFNGDKEPPSRSYLVAQGAQLRTSPATRALEELIATKSFFAEKFRPNWSPQQVREFVEPQESYLRFLLDG